VYNNVISYYFIIVVGFFSSSSSTKQNEKKNHPINAGNDVISTRCVVARDTSG